MGICALIYTTSYFDSAVKMELFYGAMKSRNPDASWRRQQSFLKVFVSFSFDDIAALIAGPIRDQLANLGTPIGFNDLLMSNKRALVSTSHFIFVNLS
ncbi:MAG: type II toxin-antitoxin system VapC family toxin [Stigonema ocellatum SAG 48.90 = DSM 106950]|nr:type II toxin-antitoxin system VapC family toxin [Stigonema ocellatum SAG 48.90 = DSM 106950]